MENVQFEVFRKEAFHLADIFAGIIYENEMDKL